MRKVKNTTEWCKRKYPQPPSSRARHCPETAVVCPKDTPSDSFKIFTYCRAGNFMFYVIISILNIHIIKLRYILKLLQRFSSLPINPLCTH